jgi:pimeloyl-ACP methyl ester carboxylesterase
MKMRTVIFATSLALACMLFSQAAWAQSEPRSGHFMTSDGVKLHYLEAGSGPTIVFVDMFLGVDEKLGEQHPYEAGWRPWIAGLHLDRRNFTHEWLRGFYHSEQSDEYFDAMTEAVLATPTNTAVTLLSNLMLMEERDWRPVVDTLDRPVLFVASSQPWAVAEAEMVRERWPQIRVAVIENTGHALFVDKPERFNRVLEEFLTTLPEQ